MPFSVKDGVNLSYIDALYTSTSAVCVTGMTVVDVGTTFTVLGQVIVAILVQIGGLGVTTVGAGIILALNKKINLKGVSIIRESSNLSSRGGIVKFVRDIFITTAIIELVGAVFFYTIFVQYMSPLTAIGVSLFHSVASFNNAGFDVFGGIEGFNSFGSITPFRNNVLFNLVTCLLIVLGGIGFLVIRELRSKKFNWKKYSMHTKVVLVMSGTLIILGTILLKLTEGENISWLGALFLSVSTRTAGFSNYPISSFSNAGLLVVIIFMYIGASPGSTGGGIKTTTLFAIFQGVKSSATNKNEKAFKWSMPKDTYKKASVIAFLSVFAILIGTFLISALEPELVFRDVLFEVTSAFGTVGLSTGITQSLGTISKIITMILMYIGRLGPLTIASMWYFTRGERFSYPEGNISIG